MNKFYLEKVKKVATNFCIVVLACCSFQSLSVQNSASYMHAKRYNLNGQLTILLTYKEYTILSMNKDNIDFFLENLIKVIDQLTIFFINIILLMSLKLLKK